MNHIPLWLSGNTLHKAFSATVEGKEKKKIFKVFIRPAQKLKNTQM